MHSMLNIISASNKRQRYIIVTMCFKWLNIITNYRKCFSPIVHNVGNSFECPFKRSINAKHFIYNIVNVTVNLKNIYQSHGNPNMLTHVRALG